MTVGGDAAAAGADAGGVDETGLSARIALPAI